MLRVFVLYASSLHSCNIQYRGRGLSSHLHAEINQNCSFLFRLHTNLFFPSTFWLSRILTETLQSWYCSSRAHCVLLLLLSVTVFPSTGYHFFSLNTQNLHISEYAFRMVHLAVDHCWSSLSFLMSFCGSRILRLVVEDGSLYSNPVKSAYFQYRPRVDLWRFQDPHLIGLVPG